MAGQEDPVTYSAQHIEELLRCAICLDRYRSPKLLPCQHTFCGSPCLEQLVDRFHQIKCPECRTSHRVPYGGVAAFPTNRTIKNFLDLPTQRRSLIQTVNQVLNIQPEDTQNEESTILPHREQPQPAQTVAVNETPRTGCTLCGRQMAISRCCHCDSVICSTCKKSHMDQTRLDINRLVSQLRRGLPVFSDSISVIENKSEQLHQRAEAGKADITETIQRYISELRNRQMLLHSEVQMWLLGEIRSLRMLQENVEVELASTASFCDSTESVLSCPNQVIPDNDLVDIKRQCVEHMEIIRQYEEGNGVRLPRGRRVQVAFEGNRFSQAISNFGELSIVERDEHDELPNSNSTSDPPSLNSRSSSSRESSPAVAPMVAVGRAQGRLPPSIDAALEAIGSNGRTAARQTDRVGGIMSLDVGGGSSVGNDTSSSVARPSPRERLSGLLASNLVVNQSAHAQPAVNQSLNTPRERVEGFLSSGSGGSESGASPQQARRALPPNLSWELPVDFSFPPRNNIRTGNGNLPNTRRSLQERRRHNLTDSDLLNNLGLGAGQNRNQARTNQARKRNRSESLLAPTAQDIESEPVASTSSQDPDRPQLMRSRTYTREEFQTIREEDNTSRASTADPTNRPREPVRFDIDVDINGEVNPTEEVTYRVGSVDSSESTRVNVPRNNYQDKGRAIIRFGARGSNEREFIWPRGIAVFRGDQIYVADSSNHRVQVFDNVGTYFKSFGSYGQADGEFDCLAGIAMNTMGNILITDRYNHRVQVFDHQGNFCFKFGEEGTGDGQLCHPWGIACDSMGFIYVCDKESHRIQVFQSNGVFARKFGSLGRQAGQFENPHYLAISPDNKIYVSDCTNHRIQVFSMYGDFIFQFGSIGTMQGQMKYPKGIAIDEQGFVVVADSGNNRIQVFRGDGRFYCMFGGYGSDNGQFKGLEGLAILGNGNVAVCDRENHRIQIF